MSVFIARLLERSGWVAILVPPMILAVLLLQLGAGSDSAGAAVADVAALRRAVTALGAASGERDPAAGGRLEVARRAADVRDIRNRLDAHLAGFAERAEIASALERFDAASAQLIAVVSGTSGTAGTDARGVTLAAAAAVDGLMLAVGGEIEGTVAGSRWLALAPPVAVLLAAAAVSAGALAAASWLRRRAERLVRLLEGRWRDASELMSDLYYETDARGRLVAVGQRARELLGREPASMIGRPLGDFATPAGLRHAGPAVEHEWRHAGGAIVHLETTSVPRPGGGERAIARMPGSGGEARDALIESEERFRRLLDTSQNGLMLVAADGRLLLYNEALRQMLGYPPHALDGASIARLVPAGELDRIMGALAIRLWSSASSGRDETELVRSDGQRLQVEMSTSPFREGERDGAVLVEIRDVTEHRRASETIRRLADYDSLTGLPNRAHFERRLQRILIDARHGHRAVGVLLIDLDRFKLVNDTLGHASGDCLLGAVAQRLTASLSRRYVVARFGGDEFMVLVPELDRKETLKEVAGEIADALEPPFEHDGKHFRLTASIGGSMFPVDADGAEALVGRAATAMHLAKEHGRNSFRSYERDQAGRAPGRLELEAELQRAFERDEFTLHYQPLVSLQTSEIVAVEALLRWQHPRRGLVPAAEFIETLEDSGLIMAVGEHVLEQACVQARCWLDEGLGPIRVAVNLSARQFLHRDLAAVVRGALDRSGLDPALLELEVTETTATLNLSEARRVLQALRAIGVTIAIDDFGIGHSSLGRLRELPVSTLKIDRSFIRNLAGSPDDSAIVRGIVALGHALGLSVVAEGVETRSQALLLQSVDCDVAQGFHYARPAGAEALSDRLRAGRRLAA